MTAVIASIGSVIGYVGAEVAEGAIFERVLWPQRFYNYLDAFTALKLGLFMPMGGPLHRAALEVLDRFREQGLYRGRADGHMLGTAFFSCQEATRYLHHTARNIEDREIKKEVRNGLWVEAIKRIDPRTTFSHQHQRESLNKDEESAGSTGRRPKRTTQYLFHLSLVEQREIPKGECAIISEAHITSSTVISILLSETLSVACAVLVTVLDAYYAFTVLFCFPLVLKLLSLISCVRREPLRDCPVGTVSRLGAGESLGNSSGVKPPLQSVESLEGATSLTPRPAHAEIFEILLPNHGPVFIETDRATTLLQFTRHYGHPIRSGKYDRFKELLSMSIVYMFALNFPAALIALTWAPLNSQYIWIAYQAYTVLAMHVTRLVGWGGCGRTEERIARVLGHGQELYLRGRGDTVIRCKLLVERCASIAEGETRRKEILSKLSTD